jgi:hypothetical protein
MELLLRGNQEHTNEQLFTPLRRMARSAHFEAALRAAFMTMYVSTTITQSEFIRCRSRAGRFGGGIDERSRTGEGPDAMKCCAGMKAEGARQVGTNLG